MISLVALTLAQVAGPLVPLGGARALHAYPSLPTEGDLAFLADGGLAIVWADQRRTLGHARSPTTTDLWLRGFDTNNDVATPPRLVASAIPDDSVRSLRIAANGSLVLVAWVEGPELGLMRSVQFRLWNGQAFQTLPAIPDVAPNGGVAVIPYESFFAAGWSTARGAKKVRVSSVGTSQTPAEWNIALLQPVLEPLIAQHTDGGLLLAGRVGNAAFLEGAAAPLMSPSRPMGLLPNFDQPLAAAAGIPVSAVFSGVSGNRVLLTPNLVVPLLGSRAARMGTDAVIATAGTSSIVALVSETAQVYQAVSVASDGRRILGLAASATQGAVLREQAGLFLEPIGRSANGVEVAGGAELSEFQAAQRFPSVAWHESAASFAVVYEVTTGPNNNAAMLWSTDVDFIQPANHRTVMSITARGLVPPEPRLVEVAPGVVELEQRAVASVDNRGLRADGTTQLQTFSRPLGWLSSNGLPRLAFRSQGPTAEVMFETLGTAPLGLSPPRCAAGINGVHYLAGWNQARSALSIAAVPTDGGVIVTQPIAMRVSALFPSSVCLTRSAWGPSVVLSWNEDDMARVVVLDVRGPSLQLVRDLSFSISNIQDPIAVQLGDGVLIVGESKAGFGLLPGVYLGFDGSAVVLTPLATGDSVRNPAVAVRPNSEALVAWQQFDPSVGATRVYSRLVYPPAGRPDAGLSADGGAPLDAGTGPDAGTPPDAGSGLDGGLTPDAGPGADGGLTPDSGVAALDGGTTADGGEALQFVPSCGCSSSGLPAMLSVALGAALRMRKRRQ